MHSLKSYKLSRRILSDVVCLKSNLRNSPSLSQTSDRDRINSGEDNSLSVEEKARELIEFLTKR